MELTFQKNEEYVITLKEITDLIGVEHNKAMRKVEDLALEEGFGLLAKTAIKQKLGCSEEFSERNFALAKTKDKQGWKKMGSLVARSSI